MDDKIHNLLVKNILKSNHRKGLNGKERGVVIFCEIAEILRDKNHNNIVILDFKDYPDIDEDLFLSYFAHLYTLGFSNKFLDEHIRIHGLNANAQILVETAWSKVFRMYDENSFL